MKINTDTDLRTALQSAEVIAVVGHSDKPHRTSYRIASYLRTVGYTVIPVNPTVSEIDGRKSYPSLAAVPGEIDIVNVFRRSEYLEGHVAEAIEVGAELVWAQLGVHDDDAVARAQEVGLDIVTDRCIKVEYRRLVR